MRLEPNSFKMLGRSPGLCNTTTGVLTDDEDLARTRTFTQVRVPRPPNLLQLFLPAGVS